MEAILQSSAPILSASAVLARLKEFLRDTTPWSRRLWDAGTILSLRELYDAIEWSEAKVLSASTVKWLANDLERLVGRDRGIGGKDVRAHLRATLAGPLKSGSSAQRTLKRLTEMIAEDYLLRWRDAAASSNPPGTERTARAVASHLLDLGYSMSYLDEWAKTLRVASLADLIGEAHELTLVEPSEFEVMVPFTSVSDLGGNRTASPAWVTPSNASSWFRGRSLTQPRHNGGFLYRVSARDYLGAAQQASDNVDRMISRATLSRRSIEFEPVGEVWVSGHGNAIPFARPNRSAHVLSLIKEKRLYDVGRRSELDNALELAAILNDGSAGPAVSGGWSAIESLLLSPKDETEEGRGVLAAERMAAIIACAWPRAELTALSYLHEPASPDVLQRTLDGEVVNRERGRAVLAALEAGRPVAVRRASDDAAVARMQGLQANARATLTDVRKHMSSAMRRLYRHRNLVMHGGATDVPTLDMALRTTAPLVGAGLDRITHAALTDGITPLTLASKAELNLRLVGGTDARGLTDLLE